jgi:hypothetical protein
MTHGTYYFGFFAIFAAIAYIMAIDQNVAIYTDLLFRWVKVKVVGGVMKVFLFPRIWLDYKILKIKKSWKMKNGKS